MRYTTNGRESLPLSSSHLFMESIMDYQAIYECLISKYKDHPKIKFQTNDHHIIPKCFKKIDNVEDIDGRWNRVHLPHRAHFIAHLLLARIWRHHKVKGPMMARAINLMQKDETYNARKYAWLKLDYSIPNETKMKMSKSHSKLWTTERRQKQSELYKGRVGKKWTEEEKLKMSIKKKGKQGQNHSIETKQKISAIAKNRPKLLCPICNRKIKGHNNLVQHLRTHQK